MLNCPPAGTDTKFLFPVRSLPIPNEKDYVIVRGTTATLLHVTCAFVILKVINSEIILFRFALISDSTRHTFECIPFEVGVWDV